MKRIVVLIGLFFISIIVGFQPSKAPRLENNTTYDPIPLVPGYEMPLSFSAETIYAHDVIITGSFIAPNVGGFKVTHYYIVKKGPSYGYQEYPTIHAALAAITDNDSTHLYVIQVMPGIYVEDTITCKPYVSIIGESPADCIVQANGPGKHCVVGIAHSLIQNLTLMTGYPNDEGWAAFDYEDSGSMNIFSCWFNTSNTMIKIRSSGVSASDIYGSQCVFTPTCEFTHGIDMQGAGFVSPIVTAAFDGLIYNPVTLPSMVSECVKVYGLGAFFTSFGSSFGNFFYVGAQPCVTVYDGAVMWLASCSIGGFATGLYIPTLGDNGPMVNTSAIVMAANTVDVLVTDARARGSINGQVSKNKVSIASDASISLMYQDQGITGSGSGIVMSGQLFTGFKQEFVTDTMPLIQYSLALGKITGGDLTITATCCQVHVAAGTGYVSVPVVGGKPYLLYNEWSAQDVSLTPSALSYVYIDAYGTAQSAGSLVDTYDVIPLGAVFTSSASVSYIQRIPRDSYHVETQLDTAWRMALGAIYKSGSIVTKNATPFKLDVSSGDYFFSTLEFQPSGGTAITFETNYGNSLSFGSTDTVDVMHYDNAGVLTLLGPTMFAKHAFYTTGQGDQERYFLVYGQEEFDTLAHAQSGSIPIPPTTFNEDIVLIASLIVTPASGSPEIAEIRDERPRLGFKAAGVSGTFIHAALSGLGADDHLQYLLVTGTRAMAGNLDMGIKNIINVDTVNTVTIESHRDRHMPEGADPLPTGIPVSIGTTNQIGIQNSFSHSDHVHAHDNLLGGTLHACATALSAGFTSTADKIKLDAATALNTPSTLVMRDGSSNFSAGTIAATTFMGSLTGYASVDMPLTGSTMSGSLNMGGYDISNAGAIAATEFNGSLTGIVTGTLIGAASLNVLKSGDTMTGYLVIPAGTAAAPALTFTTGSTTGLSSQTINTLVLSTAGLTRLTIGSSGTIAMNTPTSGVTLTVNGDELVTGTLTINGVMTGTWVGHESLDLLLAGGTMSGAINMGSQAITNAGVVTSTGFSGPLNGIVTGTLTGAASLNVLKAGDTMSGALVIPAGTAALPSLNFTGSATTGLSAQTANTLVLSTAATARMSIGSAGNVIMNAPTGGTTLTVNSDGLVTGTLTVGGSLTVIGMMLDSIILPVTSSSSVGLITQSGSQLLHTYGTRNTFLGSGAGRINAGFTGTDTIGMGVNTLSSVSLTSGTGNIGIGSAVLLPCTTGLDNVAIGFNALNANTTGSYNTALGVWALALHDIYNNNTGVGSNALINNAVDGSTAIGYGAMGANGSGLYNTAFGYNALSLITTSSGCTAVGYQALLQSTGRYNTGIGCGVLANTTTGVSNTAVGYQALISNSSSNTAIGYHALAANTTAAGSTVIGSGAMALNMSGLYNVALGYHALAANTTATDSTAIGYNALAANNASYNTAIGSGALAANTSGTNNTAIGYQALTANTTATDSTAIGYNALVANNASYNTAIGSGALAANTSGINNTAIGYHALAINTTATDSTAIGYNALAVNNASYNTAIGSGALAINDSGTSNTAIGAGALAVNNSGTNNTAIGYDALLSNTSGVNNTAIGSGALATNNSGINNTAIGYQALAVNTTATDNTAIGYQALAANNDASYNTAVGSGALAASQGLYNTACGYQALSSIITVSCCTAIGSQALLNNRSFCNTAVGWQSLQANVGGNNNVAFGCQALCTNTTGSRNTAVGYQSQHSGINNFDNTAVGYQSLYSNSADGNTAVGWKALYGDISGWGNVAFGYSALSTTTTASCCTAIGYETAKSNVSGIGNTALGSEALYTNVTSSNNTCVGYNAGHVMTGSQNTCIGSGAGSAITTGNTNTMIGYNAGSGVSTASNVTCIGSIAGTNTASSTFIANVRGVSTSVGDAINVVIDSNGQLGTASSSRRFKENIADIGSYSEKLYKLRPVSFIYKSDATQRPQYGLIAQEVQEIMPELVVTDQDGQVYTVMYQNIPPLMLNELQKQYTRIQRNQERIDNQQRILVDQQLVIDKQQMLFDQLCAACNDRGIDPLA